MSAISVFGDLDQKVDALLNSGYGKANVAAIKGSERPQVILRLKRYASGDLTGYVSQAKYLLIELGDTDAITKEIHSYHGDDMRKAMLLLRKSKQPLLIPLLARDLALIEPTTDKLLKSEFLIPPRSVSSGEIIRSVIINSSEFTSEVKTWALQLNTDNREGFRTVMRQWWKENKKYFDVKNYAAVRPPGAEKKDATGISKPRSKKK